METATIKKKNIVRFCLSVQLMRHLANYAVLYNSLYKCKNVAKIVKLLTLMRILHRYIVHTVHCLFILKSTNLFKKSFCMSKKAYSFSI